MNHFSKKYSIFQETFGFHLENLVPLSLYHEDEIRSSIVKNIKKSSDTCDYYSTHSKIDLYIYSHQENKWVFIPNGIHINVYQLL